MTHPRSPAWRIAWFGLGLLVFSVVALSAAGRIDVIDGQTRYQVGRSLVEHGDSIVRDQDTWFMVFRGRNGERYSNYRLPHSVVAAASILLSDATGPISELRRQFFFSLSGAVLCGLIGLVYASWFRQAGQGWRESLAWAAGGVFCTPLWYYGTTAYDDVLGTLVVLMAIYEGRYKGRRQKAEGRTPSSVFCLLPSAFCLSSALCLLPSAFSGLLLGLAFNCKPPLILFMPVAIAALWNRELTRKERWLRIRVVFFCAALGMIVYECYDLWKFPPSTWAALAEQRAEYVALWPGTPWAGLLSLLVSPGMGAIWYWPAIVVAVYGLVSLARTRRNIGLKLPTSPGSSVARWVAEFVRILAAKDREQSSHEVCYMAPPAAERGGCPDSRFAVMAGLSSLAFLCFIATIRFFSGEPAWGPRYLTPVFGLLWLFVPMAASRLRWTRTACLLTASFAVQVMGLTLDPLRFFTGDNVVAAEAFLWNPWTYFRFDRSQLFARPRQVWDVLTYDGPAAPTFTPAKSPTLPLVIDIRPGKQFETHAYQVFRSLRPWWATYRHLPPEQRPIDLRAGLACLLFIGGAGLTLLALPFLPIALFRRARRTRECFTLSGPGMESRRAGTSPSRTDIDGLGRPSSEIDLALSSSANPLR